LDETLLPQGVLQKPDPYKREKRDISVVVCPIKSGASVFFDTFGLAFPNGKIVVGGRIADRTTERALAAYAARRPAGVGAALRYASLGHARRAVYADGTAEMYGDTKRPDFVGMEGGEDAGVEMLFFFDQERRPFGAVVNAACPAQVMEARRVISSDYMGALREKLKTQYGEDFHTVCQIGSAGCQSPRDLTRDMAGRVALWGEEGVAKLAESLQGAVAAGLEAARRHMDRVPALAHRKEVLRLPVRRVTYDEYRTALRERERLESQQDSRSAYLDFCQEVLRNEQAANRPGPYDSKLHHFVQIRAREAIMDRYAAQNTRPCADIEIHGIRVGRAVFVSNPFELFLVYGQCIKARSPAERTFVVQLANGSHAYLPSRTAELHGGYGGEVINGEVGSEGGSMLVEESLRLIAALMPTTGTVAAEE
jgi:hypothetical protein